MWDTHHLLLAREAASQCSEEQRAQMILIAVPLNQREPHLWQLAELILGISATVVSETVSFGKQPGLDAGNPVSI